MKNFQSATPVYRRLCSEWGDTSTLNIHLKGKWLRKAGFETGAHLTIKISNGCIVLILNREKVDDLKHKQALLIKQFRDIDLSNKNIKKCSVE
ncbi:SymE family type I addiction module toxin [Rahnella laticis]|uniref:SymE family type I addiction module toxin n=1 Tax=Rahnella laticis TaxID=2787622 RepID=UPI0018A2B851|nr:SymE family type I addiction module toxin [Rahnella laticis]MBF7996278.1 type I addiction module toxin, SymE family [Rahnella laticis]